jgi:hypothetical protein
MYAVAAEGALIPLLQRDVHEDAQYLDKCRRGEPVLRVQVESIKEHAVYVSQLRRVGKGLGVYMFDRFLTEKNAA